MTIEELDKLWANDTFDPVENTAWGRGSYQSWRTLRAALLAAKEWLRAADENHQEKLMRESLRSKLKELGL